MVAFVRKHWPVLFLLLVPIVPLFRAILLGEAIGPFDQIRHMSPWNGPQPVGPWDVLQADGILQFYVWRDLVFQSWGHFQIPTWNPYELGGTPLLANSQSAAFYPLHILVGILHIPTALGITLLAWFHLSWSGLGAYFLARRLGASRVGAVIAGSGFSMSAFMLSWTALASVITTVAWIPWILGFIVVLFQTRKLSAASLLAVCTGMMFLGGHLQFAAYGTMAAIFVALGLGIVDRKAFPISLAILLPLVLGLILAAGQLLPVLSFGHNSHRQNKPSAEGYADYAAKALKPYDLATLANGAALGSPRVAVEAAGMRVGQYWPPFAKPGASYAESAICVGPFALVLLAFIPWRKRPDLAVFGVLAVVALLLALGTILNAPLYFGVPNWSATGSPGRVVFLFVLLIFVLGGIGYDGALTATNRTRGIALAVVAVFCLALTAMGVAGDPGWIKGAEALGKALQADSFSNALMVGVLSLVLAAAGIGLTTEQASKYRPAVIVLPLILAWIGYASNIIPTGEPLTTLATPASGGRVAIINNGWGLYDTPNALLPPNLAALLRIHELGGYDSLDDRRAVAELTQINGQDPAPAANGNMMFVKPTADPKLLANAGVTEVWSRKPLPQSFGSPTEKAGYLAYQVSSDFHGLVSGTGGQVGLTEDSTNLLTLHFQGASDAKVAMRAIEGWEVEGGQGSVVNHDGLAVMTVRAPSEHYQGALTLRYTPPGMRLGMAIAGLLWLTIGCHLLVVLIKKFRPKEA